MDFTRVIFEKPLLSILYMMLSALSILLAVSLIKYYFKSRKLVAKYLAASLLFIGVSTCFYFITFVIYLNYGANSFLFAKFAGVSNLLLGIGMCFAVLYLHIMVYRSIKLYLVFLYFLPIIIIALNMTFIYDFNLVRLISGTMYLIIILLLSAYLALFAKYLIKELFKKQKLLPEIKLGFVTYMISIGLAGLAIVSQIFANLLKVPLYSWTAVLSTISGSIALILLYLPTTLPSWYIKLARSLFRYSS